jgi:SAM-dependent methyltransferase
MAKGNDKMAKNHSLSECDGDTPDFTSQWSKFKDRIRRSLPQSLKNAYRLLAPRSMKEAFTEVYQRDDWCGGSGRGSVPENTTEYRRLIEKFIRTHAIERIVDIGCGDWQFSRLIDWGNIDYLGIDTVPAVIEANRKRFGTRYNFMCLDVTCDDLPAGELLLIKDVLQHWPNAVIQRFLPRLAQYRYVILTNDGYPSTTLNTDIRMTGYRPLDLRQPPFSFDAEELLRYRTDEVPLEQWNKLVLLHRSRIS